ncbi:hypothetical protein I317_01712 [Kwoniella heveanensis CBS 569]|nr:hypothetical protein I317_01712 [Kwoniella heveanensis CBS 569]
MLSAPRAAGSSTSSSSRGVLGGPAPKRGWGLKVKEGYEKKKEDKPAKPAFAPRQHQKKVESQYKDRAEMRRTGVDDEYRSVEKLLEDFEARKASATRPEELEELEKQRAYLGGDAEHSVLVKGLDYALLAARKAELAREEGEEMDDELEMLGQGLGKKDTKEGKKEKKEEGLGKGFKSIAQKKAEAEAVSGEKKKKKKKKKVKPEPEPEAGESAQPSRLAAGFGRPEEPDAVGMEGRPPAKAEAVPESGAKTTKNIAPPPPVEDDDDDDIFGGVGEYNLGGGAESDSDDEDEKMDVDPPLRGRSPIRGRSRTRSPHARKDGLGPRSPGYRHDRSYSRSRSRDGSPYHRRRDSRYRSISPSRSRSRSRGYRRFSRSRSRSYDRRSPSPYRYRRYRSRTRSRSRSPYRGYRRSPSPPRGGYRAGYRSRSRSRSPRRNRSPLRSRSPRRHSPRRRSYTPRRSPSPKSVSPAPAPAPRVRSPTRSPTPLLHDHPIANSRSPSPEYDGPQATKLQPLSSSAIPSLKNFLEADSEASKADEKRLKKAKWRAAQGLPTQEGGAEMLQDGKGGGMNEKQKANRDYQLLMNKMNKDQAGAKMQEDE